jgi:hypothetical protein
MICEQRKRTTSATNALIMLWLYLCQESGSPIIIPKIKRAYISDAAAKNPASNDRLAMYIKSMLGRNTSAAGQSSGFGYQYDLYRQKMLGQPTSNGSSLSSWDSYLDLIRPNIGNEGYKSVTLAELDRMSAFNQLRAEINLRNSGGTSSSNRNASAGVSIAVGYASGIVSADTYNAYQYWSALNSSERIGVPSVIGSSAAAGLSWVGIGVGTGIDAGINIYNGAPSEKIAADAVADVTYGAGGLLAAAAGAFIGTVVFPGVGSVIGAIVGGVVYYYTMNHLEINGKTANDAYRDWNNGLWGVK